MPAAVVIDLLDGVDGKGVDGKGKSGDKTKNKSAYGFGGKGESSPVRWVHTHSQPSRPYFHPVQWVRARPTRSARLSSRNEGSVDSLALAIAAVSQGSDREALQACATRLDEILVLLETGSPRDLPIPDDVDDDVDDQRLLLHHWHSRTEQIYNCVTVIPQ